MTAAPAEGTSAPPTRPAVLRVRGLTLRLPDGVALFEELDLEVRPGEIVVVLGGSGAGKSTLARVLFDRERLAADGFTLTASELACDAPLGLVPQRGALFDHLDVAGNLELALRRSPEPPVSRPALAEAVRRWLAEVDLPAELGTPGSLVTKLSGGQGQRLAVARTLAGGRSVLFLDEPSVGLDPYRVDGLATLVREQCDQRAAAAVVVTHDLALAVGVADRLLVLDGPSGKLVPLFAPEAGPWPGPFARKGADTSARAQWQAAAEQALTARLSAPAARHRKLGGAVGRRAFAGLTRLVRPFRVAAESIITAPGELAKHPGDFAHVWWRALVQALLRPVAFYGVVATLLGFTVLYVISHTAPIGVRPEAAIEMVGGSYIVALTPPIAAFLFVAASGNATNAWLGGMGLTKQIAALEALGVRRERYLWAPVYAALVLSFLAVCAVFAGGLLAGGLLMCRLEHVPGGWSLLSPDLLHPLPERAIYKTRALWLATIYAFGIAADVVGRGSADKEHSDEVTRAMTSSVVACTLWVVALELTSAFAVFAAGQP